MKLSLKLIISIIIISLFSMFLFEFTYNRMIYKDYTKVYDEYIEVENRMDKVLDMNLKLTEYIIKGDNNGKRVNKSVE